MTEFKIKTSKENEKGIFIAEAPDRENLNIVKKADENQKRKQESRLFGLIKKDGLYLPNNLAKKEQSGLAKAVTGTILTSAAILGGCSSIKKSSHPEEYLRALGKNNIEYTPIGLDEKEPNEHKKEDIPKTIITPDEFSPKDFSLMLYGTERKGKEKPNNFIRGVGFNAGVALGKNRIIDGDRISLYGGIEYLTKEATSRTPVGEIYTNTEVIIPKLGLDYNVPIIKGILNLGANAEIGKWQEKYRMSGIIGNTHINENMKDSHYFTGASIYANLGFGKDSSFRLGVGIGRENHDPMNERDNVHNKYLNTFRVQGAIDF